MLRALFLILKMIVLATLVVWVATHQGHIRIEWLSYVFTIHIGLFFTGVLLVIGSAVFLYQLYRGIVTLPARWRRYKLFKAQEKGLAALSTGLSAVAAGDVKQAALQARKAQKYLPADTGLSLLLQAQAARMAGQDQQARHFLARLMRDKRAGFLGVRGLLQKALDDGNDSQARLIVSQSLKDHGKNPWLLQAGYRLALKGRDWARGLDFLGKLEALDVLDKQIVSSDRRTLLIAQADAVQPDDAGAARRLLEKALKIDPYFPPLLKRLVGLYLDGKARKKAQGLLEKAWKQAPHPEIALLWDAVLPPKKTGKVMARVQWGERLVKMQPSEPESYLALAHVTLSEGLWGETREHLMRAKSLYEGEGRAGSSRLFQLLAALERRQNQNEKAAQEWLLLARQAEPTEAWICRETGRVYDQWLVSATPHGGFNTICWTKPVADYAGRSAFDESDRMVGLLGR